MDAFRDNNISRFIRILKKDFGLYFSISLGVFIFILFFQPFPIDHFDFNNSLLFTAGLAAIVLITIILARNILPSLFYKRPEPVIPAYLDIAFISIFTTVAFAFYIRYVGSIPLSFYLMAKVLFVCFMPPVVIGVADILHELRKTNNSLSAEIDRMKNHVDKLEEEYISKTIGFIADDSGDNLNLVISDIALIKSADNYVEIVILEAGVFKRKLIRSTLKNVEHLLKPYKEFMRCHRKFIVNRTFIEKLSRKFNNYFLIINGYDEQIPVSRQYLVNVREVL